MELKPRRLRTIWRTRLSLNRTFYGIETEGIKVKIVRSPGLNRTFYGIETQDDAL